MNKVIIGEELKDKITVFRETCFGLVIQDNKFLCVKDKNEISLIGGGIDKNENHEQCLRREFLEEAGRTINTIKELCVIDCYWQTKDGVYMNSLSNIFIVELTDEILKPQEDKETIFVDFESIIDLLPLPYQKEAIKQYFTKKGFTIKKNIINDEINILQIESLTNNKNAIIYCHGLGSNKEQIKRFYKKIYKSNLSIISFDLPAHGEDKKDFKEFSLTQSTKYLNNVIKYIKKKYKKIYLFGSSYGGYVILNYLINSPEEHTVLMCPAINFGEIINEKTKISKDYFETNEYIHLYGNVQIYKDAYEEFMKSDKHIKKAQFNNITIIQGDADQTVSYEKVENFAKDNNLNLVTINDGTHELYQFNKEITDVLLNEIK